MCPVMAITRSMRPSTRFEEYRGETRFEMYRATVKSMETFSDIQNYKIHFSSTQSKC